MAVTGGGEQSGSSSRKSSSCSSSTGCLGMSDRRSSTVARLDKTPAPAGRNQKGQQHVREGRLCSRWDPPAVSTFHLPAHSGTSCSSVSHLDQCSTPDGKDSPAVCSKSTHVFLVLLLPVFYYLYWRCLTSERKCGCVWCGPCVLMQTLTLENKDLFL